MRNDRILRIYTDGGCAGNQSDENLGGWGAIMEFGGAQKELYTISGTVPTAGNFSSGCRFADRCIRCTEQCRKSIPTLSEIEPGHLCRCFLHSKTETEGQA